MEEAYCVKCRQKQPIINTKIVTTRTNKKAIKGQCKVCHTNLMRFIKSNSSY